LNESADDRREREAREIEAAEDAEFRAELELQSREHLIEYILASRRISEKHFLSMLQGNESVRQENLKNRRWRRAGPEAKKKKDSDGKQAAKAEAKRRWLDWQSRKSLHKSGAAFARYVVDEIDALDSEKTVERWARQWAKEGKSQPQARP
jgi:hypothetical protein